MNLMQKNNKLFITIYAITVFLTLFYLIFALVTTATTKEDHSEPAPQIAGFTVKEHNGKIAVFQNGNDDPIKILDGPYVRDLPTHDRELLQNGIVVETETELIALLEDYDG